LHRGSPYGCVITMAKFIDSNVTNNLTGWKRYEKAVTKELRKGTAEFKGVYEKWAQKYRKFLFVRFKKFSRGGGNWRKTSKSTRDKKGSNLILRDTDTLLRAFTPVFKGLPGQFQQFVSNGIAVGVGGPGKHPASPITVGQLAEYHHEGIGNNPRRLVMIQPTASLNRDLSTDIKKALDKIAKKNKLSK